MRALNAQLAHPIQLEVRFADQQWQKIFHQPVVTIGRTSEAGKPDLDLSLDMNISRRQARLWREGDTCWLEDLGSKFGTTINGSKLQPNTRWKLGEGDKIIMGGTEISVKTSSAIPLAKAEDLPVTVSIGESLDAAGNALELSSPQNDLDSLRQFLDLALELSNHTRLNELLPALLNKIVDMIPGAQRGALLLQGLDAKHLVLAAFVSEGEPAVSETLAQRAFNERRGFIWRQNFQVDPALSIQRHNIVSGMYVPLICRGETLGVICVDRPDEGPEFSEHDLRLLLAVANFAATAVANHQLQENLRENSKMLERLLTNFSPKLRTILLEKARMGRLRPGGEKSEVTLLFSDIRDFSIKSANMDPGDVVAMLNDYLPALGQAIFQFDGTIDKFVGDAVIAVFGSPEPDVHQHEKAVQAALAMQAAMADVTARRAARGEPVCEIGIGVHCGEVLHGFIGAADRMEFTVIGDAVNRTSRFCSGARAGEILISFELYQRVFAKVQSEKASIVTKHGEEFVAYRVKAIQN